MAIRGTILGARNTTSAIETLLHRASIVPAEAYAAFAAALGPEDMDMVVTTWVKLGHEAVHFGTGPVKFTGHFGLLGCLITVIPDGDDYIVAVPVTNAGLHCLAESKVLTELAPSTKRAQIFRALEQQQQQQKLPAGLDVHVHTNVHT